MPQGEVTADTVLGILNGGDPGGSEAPVETPETPVESPAPAPKGAEPSGEKPPEQPTPPEERPPEGEEEPPVEQPVPEGEFDPEIGPPKVVDFKGKKEWHFTPEKGKLLVEGHKEAKAYREIGSLDEVKSMAEKAIDLDAMHAHFAAGKVDSFLTYWGKKSPQGLAQMGQRLAERAKTEFPEAYDQMGSSFIKDLSDHFYQAYARSPEAEKKDANSSASKYLFGAQILEWFLTDQFKTPEQLSAAPTVDPRLGDIERREADLRRQTSERQKADWQSFEEGTYADIRKGINAKYSEALKPIARLEKEEPLVWKGAIAELRAAVEAATSEDKIFHQRFGLRFEQSQQSMSAQDRKALVEMFINRVERAINAAKPKIIESASRKFVAASAEQHRRSAESASRTEVSPGGGPSSPTVTNPKYAEAKKAKDVEGMVKSLLG